MAYGLENEEDIESWLKPYISRANLSDRDRKLVKNSRLFFILYRGLIDLGFSDQQIHEYACAIKQQQNIHEELALCNAVFKLAKDWKVTVPANFFNSSSRS